MASKKESSGITHEPSITFAGAFAGTSFTVYVQLSEVVEALKIVGRLHYANPFDMGVLMYDGKEFFINTDAGRMTYKEVENGIEYVGLQEQLLKQTAQPAEVKEPPKETKAKAKEQEKEPEPIDNSPDVHESIKAYLNYKESKMSAPIRFVLEKISFAGFDSMPDVVPFFNHILKLSGNEKDAIKSLSEINKENAKIFQQRFNKSNSDGKFAFNVQQLKTDYNNYIFMEGDFKEDLPF